MRQIPCSWLVCSVTENGSSYTCYDCGCQRPSCYLCDQDDPLSGCTDRVRIRLADVQDRDHGIERVYGLELSVCGASAGVRRIISQAVEVQASGQARGHRVQFADVCSAKIHHTVAEDRPAELHLAANGSAWP
jgi:hypothetical protein